MDVSGTDTLQGKEFSFTLDGVKLHSIVAVAPFAYLTPGDEAEMPWLTMSKRVEDNPLTVFNAWLRETLAKRIPAERPRKTFVVTAVNDGVPVRRWTFAGVWIASVVQGGILTTSHELALEEVALGYDSVACEVLGSDS